MYNAIIFKVSTELTLLWHSFTLLEISLWLDLVISEGIRYQIIETNVTAFMFVGQVLN